MNIDKEQVIAELERILNSPQFRSRKLIRTFLHYAVHETLENRGDNLNQYTIAINALGKTADFSPVYNPVVRIEAGRLRKLLHDYYSENGRHNLIAISMPKGSYQVSFRINNHFLSVLSAQENLAPHVTEGPRIAVHCQATDPQNDGIYSVCHKVRNDLLLIMSRFRNIRLVSSLPDAAPPSPPPSLDSLQQHRVDYILVCNVQTHTDSLELFCTLTHIPSNELVWTDMLSLPAPFEQTDLDTAYLQITANTITLHSGAALTHWAGYMQSLKLSALPAHHHVLVSYLEFLRNVSCENFGKALKTCQQRLERFPADAMALTILARLCGYDYVLQYNLVADRETVWLHASRMAMKLDPGGAEPHSVFAHNCFWRGDAELCRSELEIARKINPFDTSIEYLYGLGLYLLGDQQAGMQAINTLMAIPFAHPDWYHILPFLHAFDQGNYQEALALAERIQQFGLWGELARCVSYFKLGQIGRSIEELQNLSRHNTNLPDSGITDKRSIFSYKAFKKLLDTLIEMQQTLPN